MSITRMGQTRTFNGKRYGYHSRHHTKAEAKAEAKRMQDRWYARIDKGIFAGRVSYFLYRKLK